MWSSNAWRAPPDDNTEVHAFVSSHVEAGAVIVVIEPGVGQLDVAWDASRLVMPPEAFQMDLVQTAQQVIYVAAPCRLGLAGLQKGGDESHPRMQCTCAK